MGMFPESAYGAGETRSNTPVNVAFPNYLDSPSTGNVVTYTVQMANASTGSATFSLNHTGGDNNAAYTERGMSWITAMEVGP